MSSHGCTMQHPITAHTEPLFPTERIQALFTVIHAHICASGIFVSSNIVYMEGLSAAQEALLHEVLAKITTNHAHILRVFAFLLHDLLYYRPICALSPDSPLWSAWHALIYALLHGKRAEQRWVGACLVKISASQNQESLAQHGTVWCQRLLALTAVSTERGLPEVKSRRTGKVIQWFDGHVLVCCISCFFAGENRPVRAHL